MTEDVVEITQADRDAAAKLGDAVFCHPDLIALDFARHREAALSAARPFVRNEVLEEAAKVADHFAQFKRDVPESVHVHELTAKDIASTIRSLKDSDDG